MIPAQNIVAWGAIVPWADQRQVEQDLIISRAIVAIFADPFLREALRFRIISTARSSSVKNIARPISR